ncbi:hypothetical protein XO10_10185 [Marinitoga sp. 1135]|uniref:DUF4130 domain-containing protein n=1 Tax=Marinitoga piezophila (strain DSM 14283 / JCM 11233 / KA3) TaxID=443254 RepID=H2J7F7_MARPK|nr:MULTISPECIES: TIGR03915 family putative DNA repair protein [Marinitoga]AEX86450.1 hypothetical protein Marpi_2075 [Marinitoga piezophila KA3]APT76837.1 hypothetical protein LN42_10955 [Marinitoga sp. 1137]NUU96596.1 hypothetical protein [Marinitoga sp. 1135]NUU98526.1 hypothetical protein [Marinitoga sp. 1138]
MNILTYDGTFQGLLTITYYCFEKRKLPDLILKEGNKGIFGNGNIIKTDFKKAEYVSNFIKRKINNGILKNIFLAYLSEYENIEVDIIKYVNIALKLKKDPINYIEKDYILKIKKVIYKVSNEKHKFIGLLRFRELSNGLYYAPFEPDHNIIILLARHFINRFSNQNWIIHDIKRNLALVYSKGKVDLININISNQYFFKDLENLSKDEIEYQSLWKTYFNSAAITERNNSKLQKQFMPIRYWKYLTEF